MLPVSGGRTLLMPLLRDTLPGRVAVMRSLGKLQPSPGHSSSRGTALSHVVGQIGKCHSAAASHGSLSEMWDFQVCSRTPQPESAFLQDPQMNLGTVKSGKHLCLWWRAEIRCMKQSPQSWCTGTAQRDGVGRAVGGGFRTRGHMQTCG